MQGKQCFHSNATVLLCMVQHCGSASPTLTQPRLSDITSPLSALLPISGTNIPEDKNLISHRQHFPHIHSVKKYLYTISVIYFSPDASILI